MTNAEKYLTVSTKEFKNAIINTQGDIGGLYSLEKWLDTEVKPTLTEDERVILRNIKGYTTIIRNVENNIQVENGDGSFACLCAFNNLFEFIKIGEKYSIEELLGDEQ